MNAANTAPTLADFAAWLTTSQQRALDAMNASRGDTFGQHCDHFTALTTAINMVREFQQVAARAEHGTKAYDRLIQARNEVTQEAQAREEGGQQ